MSISAQDAAKKAYEYLTTVMPDMIGKISNVRIEEIEQSGVEQMNDGWKITLSYDLDGDFSFQKRRDYKIFTIDAIGNVVSMKIREL